jgi:hypothetical protein
MLKKEHIQKIEQLLKITGLEAALKDEKEIDLTIPEITTFEKTELESRDKNKKDEGIKVGRELQIKDLKEENGLTYDGPGSNDRIRFVKELSKKIETELKIEPEKKVTALTEQITLLQNKNKDYETQIESVRKEAKEAKFNSELLGELPANRSKLFTDAEYLNALKFNLEFTEEGIKRNGEILRDSKTQSPIDRKTAIGNLFTERKWNDEPNGGVAGRAGGNSATGGGKPTKLSEVVSQWEKDGKNVGSAEFQAHVITLKKENKEFDLAS